MQNILLNQCEVTFKRAAKPGEAGFTLPLYKGMNFSHVRAHLGSGAGMPNPPGVGGTTQPVVCGLTFEGARDLAAPAWESKSTAGSDAKRHLPYTPCPSAQKASL